MASEYNNTNWENISSAEVYRLSQAEFKGLTIQALSDIRQDIRDIQTNNNVTRWISFSIASIAGLLAGLFGSHAVR